MVPEVWQLPELPQNLLVPFPEVYFVQHPKLQPTFNVREIIRGKYRVPPHRKYFLLHKNMDFQFVRFNYVWAQSYGDFRAYTLK